MRAPGLLLLPLVLAGCDWWPEQLGGPHRPDALVRAPLSVERLHDSGWNDYPPLSSLGPEGLRVFIAPSFGAYRYLIDFAPRPRGCNMIRAGASLDVSEFRNLCSFVAARLIRMSNDRTSLSQAQTWRFIVPEEDFRDAIGAFDRAAAHWWGDNVIICDGTSVEIERVHAGAVTSMSTNAIRGDSPSNPGAILLPDVQRLVLAYGPSGAVPRSYDWTVSFDPASACRSDLNTPDPDGVGAGDDACARLMARPAGRPGPASPAR
jgi:hypothetical protein